MHAPSSTDPATKVEKGQVLTMEVRDWNAVYGGKAEKDRD